MISNDRIAAIVSQYERNGWQLRRLKLMDVSFVTCGLPQIVDVEIGAVDMAWFSRPPETGPISWELRFLGEPPIAFIERIDESDADAAERFAAVEQRLIDRVTSARGGA